jgi:CCR4-NOT transcription complex subunit 2
MHTPSLKTEHLSKFQLETLFYMFYSMPRDILQACAAQELYRREWRYHGELRLWLKVRGPQDLMQSHPNVQFIYFEVSAWETRLFNQNSGGSGTGSAGASSSSAAAASASIGGRGGLTSGLLSEEETKVKVSPPNTAPLGVGAPS